MAGHAERRVGALRPLVRDIAGESTISIPPKNQICADLPIVRIVRLSVDTIQHACWSANFV